MKKSRRADRVVRKKQPDGTVKEYRYPAYKPAAPRVGPESLEALIRAYKASPAWSALRPRSIENYTHSLRPLLEIGHVRAKDITRRDVLQIRDAIAQTRGPGSANGFVTAASVLFGWAVENDWLTHSPVMKVRRLPGGHLPAWTVEQAEVALTGLPERFRRVVVLGLYTGQRRGDLCKARWSDYDGQTLTIAQEKTGAVVALDVHPDLKAEMDTWERIGDTILVNGWRRPWAPRTLSEFMAHELQKLGLPKGLNVHGMRKLFAAAMADRGATTHEIAAHTGHRTLSMIQLYTRSADQRRIAKSSVDKLQTYNLDKQGDKPLK